jgi:hypothetical protein
MEQILSFETNNHIAGKEISGLLWKPKIHYHVDKSLPLLFVLNQMNHFRLEKLKL